MASVNLASIRETVRTRGDYPRSAKFTDAYVNGEIQAAWSELYEILVDANEGWFDKQGSVSTVNAQAYSALPSDCWRVSAIDLLDGSRYMELAQVTIAERNRFQVGNGKPAAYRLSSRGIELHPTPNAVYSLRLTYVPIVTPLSDGTSIELYNSWEEYIVCGALLRIAQRQERPVNELMVELGRCRERVTRAADQRQQQGPQTLRLFDLGFEDWWPTTP